ncbi:hypothetical protein DL98DRAFT_568704 [Cadophora sp. DSE1049]|nr:hypothetical protein DL98DRAFT_568704 [Cadophora sp. DSE1049]
MSWYLWRGLPRWILPNLFCPARRASRSVGFKSYNEIDLDGMPIVLLGCGHLFTTESLDGMAGMSEDLSSELAQTIPKCPDCKYAIRRHTTQRYNRVINRAAIDEMPMRFLAVIRDCNHANFPKLAIEVTCYFGKIAGALQVYFNAVKAGITKANETVQEVVGLLEKAKELCQQPFKGAGVLDEAVDNILGLLGKEWYEEVTPEELAAIKPAMFTIGECGMPMELPPCLESGARIGGQSHTTVAGVTRATEMK